MKDQMMREEFDKWMAAEFPHERLTVIGLSGQYVDDFVQGAWVAWQAARAAPAVQVPDGWKLVPTEATTDMVKAGMMVGDVGLYAIYGVMIDAAPAKEGE